MTDIDRIPPQTKYNEDDIKVLEGVEHIRKRPGMYVGGTDSRALHHLIYEVVDNSIDEALAGRCDRIMITLRADGSVSISDNGVGIPVGIQKQTGKSALEVVLTVVGGGGKFENSAYKVSGGLHGVGLTAVNALSDELHAEVYRDGFLWRQIHRRGRAITPVEKIRPLEPGEATGTTISFMPDFSVLDHNEFSYETLAQRFREMAFVTRKVSITLRDERVQPIAREMTFYFEGGLTPSSSTSTGIASPCTIPSTAKRTSKSCWKTNPRPLLALKCPSSITTPPTSQNWPSPTPSEPRMAAHTSRACGRPSPASSTVMRARPAI